MTILIKGMEMPICCQECRFRSFRDDDPNLCTLMYGEYISYLGRLPECPLIEVPTPHGRLIDADAIFEQWYQLNFDRKISDGTLAYWNVLLDKAPTVIEAEEGEE